MNQTSLHVVPVEAASSEQSKEEALKELMTQHSMRRKMSNQIEDLREIARAADMEVHRLESEIEASRWKSSQLLDLID